MIGTADSFFVVFDDNHGVAPLHEPIQDVEQHAHVLEVQAGGGFVEQVERPAGRNLGQFAAQNALSGSRWMPLPDDYGPPRVTMQVTFFYNEAPQGS